MLVTVSVVTYSERACRPSIHRINPRQVLGTALALKKDPISVASAIIVAVAFKRMHHTVRKYNRSLAYIVNS